MIYAVLTGDIVNFSKLKVSERNTVLKSLKDIFHYILSVDKGVAKLNSSYEIFRGDSFQLIVENKEHALRYCLLIRSGLRALYDNHIPDLCDAKIAVGIGNVDYIGKSLAESDGDAFRYSGRELDKLGKKERTVIKTDNPEVNRELEVELVLLDSIIVNWTFLQSRAVYEKLLESKQSIIAKKLGITRGGVSLRLSSASWYAVETLLKRYQELSKRL
ncbi:MAG: SatD family protein [Bacteroidetes bacterium]|nr:SatD family protein [Bacteroidota bacterium]